MDKKQGKLILRSKIVPRFIVIDGIDGSGKTTQVELLAKYLTDKNIPYEIISFPRYEDNLYGKLIRRYLEGEFGGIKQVNPYLMALAYAGDRALAKPEIESWLNSGKIVIANRYVSSSKAHLGANLPEDQREQFMNWIDQLEYQTNNIPKEDLSILLNMDPGIGQQNVQSKNNPDIHEDSIRHLEQAAKIYLELSQAEANWKIVDCMKDGKMKDKDIINKLIVEIIDNFLVF